MLEISEKAENEIRSLEAEIGRQCEIMEEDEIEEDEIEEEDEKEEKKQEDNKKGKIVEINSSFMTKWRIMRDGRARQEKKAEEMRKGKAEKVELEEQQKIKEEEEKQRIL